MFCDHVFITEFRCHSGAFWLHVIVNQGVVGLGVCLRMSEHLRHHLCL